MQRTINGSSLSGLGSKEAIYLFYGTQISEFEGLNVFHVCWHIFRCLLLRNLDLSTTMRTLILSAGLHFSSTTPS